MKNIILCFFIIPVMTLSVFAEEVTFNDFEEITHESKPALRHKKTKEIYPVTFSEKFYSPDKTMYAVFADAIIEKWYQTKNPSDYVLFRFIYIFNHNNKRIYNNIHALEEMSSLTNWQGLFLRIDEGPGWPGSHFYINPISGLVYSGGYGLRVDYWISENDFIFNQPHGATQLGSYVPTDYIREEIILRKLIGKNDGTTIIIFALTNFNDYIFNSKALPKALQESADLRKYNQPLVVKKRYFSYYPAGKYDIDKYKYIFKKELEIDKSGKILSTTIPPNQFGVCLADNVRIRTSPDLNGTVVGHLKKDDTFEILDASESTQVIDTMEAYWYKIKTTTLTGWVYGYFIIGKPAENDQR